MQTASRTRVVFGLILLALSLCLLVYAFWPQERVTDTQPLEPQQIPWLLPAGALPA